MGAGTSRADGRNTRALQHPGANALVIALGFIALALVLGWLIRPNNEDSADGRRDGRDAAAAEDREGNGAAGDGDAGDRDAGDGRAGDARSGDDTELAGPAEDDEGTGRTAADRGLIASFDLGAAGERWPESDGTAGGEPWPSADSPTDGSGSGSSGGAGQPAGSSGSTGGSGGGTGGSGGTDTTTPSDPSTGSPPATSTPTTRPPSTQPPATQPPTTEPSDPTLLDVVDGLLDVVGGLL